MRKQSIFAILAVLAFGQDVDLRTQVKGQLTLDATTYRFTRTNGKGASGNLSVAGAGKTITFTPCPQSVAGSAYISGGTGTAEAVSITGGTCTSGAATGTIVVTTANTHSGAWVVQSTAGGIPEAFSAIGATSSTFDGYGTGGGIVQIPCGVTSVYADIVIPSNVQLVGSGECTTLRAMTTGLNVVTTALDSQRVMVRDLTVDINAKASTTALQLNSTQNGAWQRLKVVGGAAMTTGVGLSEITTAGHNNTSFNLLDNIHVEIGPAAGMRIAGATGVPVTLNTHRHLRLTNSSTNPVMQVVQNTDTQYFYDLNVSSATPTGISLNLSADVDLNVSAYFLQNVVCEFVTNNCVLFGYTYDNIVNNLVVLGATYPYFFVANASKNTVNTVYLDGNFYAGVVQQAPFQLGITGQGTALSTPRTDVTLANGANENINSKNSSYLRVGGPTGGFSIGGFTGGIDGYRLTVTNSTAQQMTVTNQSGGSTAANRICTLTGADVVLRAGTSAANFIYSQPDGCWLLTATN